jgi:hypothetical protein
MTTEIARPADAHLHAYKAVHHANYLKVTSRAAGGTNRLIHTTELPTEGTDPVVTPALDHLYTKAVIDLTDGPVLLEVPEVPKDRYFSIHVTDQEHYTIYDEVRPTGIYAFTRRGRHDPIPSAATVIECPGDYPHLFIRVQLRNEADKPNALAIQQRITVTGTSSELDFDNPIQWVLDTHDIYPQNEGPLASVLDYDDNDHHHVADYVETSVQTIPNNIGAFGPIDSAEPGSDNPEIRAAAIIGHLGLPAEHAIYIPSFLNCEGEMLHGDHPEACDSAECAGVKLKDIRTGSGDRRARPGERCLTRHHHHCDR